MRGLLAGLTALCALALVAPASADDAPAELAAGVAAAEARGRELYRYDQAAWHATDRFLEVFDTRKSDFMRGYIVLPRDDGRLDTVFYGEVDGQLVEVARFTVDGSEVVDGGMLPEAARPPLPEVARRMAAARVAAVAELQAKAYRLCNRSSANTVVLPPDSAGTITVYVLTAPTSNDTYPLGGHYRFEVGADGKVVASRRFLNSCFELRADPPRPGSQETALFVSHLLDPQPTEIHAFASRYFRLPVYVGTAPSKLIWEVRDGRIRFVERMPSEGAPGAS